MRRSRLIGIGLVEGLAVILLAVTPVTLRPPVAFGLDDTGCSEMIVNGGFEQDDLGWQQQASPPLPAGVTLVDAFHPHIGQLGAYLAGRNGANDRLSQQMTLPASATGIKLNFWWALFTEETAGAFDQLHAALYEPSSGVLIASLLDVDNTGATDWAWNLADFDLTPYAGRTVVLRFTATNDTAGSPTIFFVDDVSVLACAGSPTSTPTSTATATVTRTPTPTASPNAPVTATVTASRTPTASPTASATASATASPTGTASATPTVTPGRRSVYLPLVIRDLR